MLKTEENSSLTLFAYIFFPYFPLVFISDITVLLSLTVFHNIVNDTLPQVSTTVPVIGSNLTQPHKCCEKKVVVSTHMSWCIYHEINLF